MRRHKIVLKGRECSIEEFEEAVDKVILSGDREQIFDLKEFCMQRLYFSKHTYPHKMESMRKCLNKLEKVLDNLEKRSEKREL